MQFDLNEVRLIGTLGKDPETKEVGSTTLTTFSVATTRSYKKGETWEKQTTWHNCVFWGKGGELAAKNLRKGSRACIMGEVITRSYEDAKGVKKYVTEIVCSDFVPLNDKRTGTTGTTSTAHEEFTQSEKEDDLPF